jgi:hypothetical protein
MQKMRLNFSAIFSERPLQRSISYSEFLSARGNHSADPSPQVCEGESLDGEQKDLEVSTET